MAQQCVGWSSSQALLSIEDGDYVRIFIARSPSPSSCSSLSQVDIELANPTATSEEELDSTELFQVVATAQHLEVKTGYGHEVRASFPSSSNTNPEDRAPRRTFKGFASEDARLFHRLFAAHHLVECEEEAYVDTWYIHQVYQIIYRDSRPVRLTDQIDDWI